MATNGACTARETRQRRTRIALVPFAIAFITVPALILLPTDPSRQAVVVWRAVLFVILFVDIPTCLCVVAEWLWRGEPPEIVMSLSPLFPSPAEREFRRRLSERPQLDDDAFYEAFFAKSEIPRHIPIRIRQMLQDAIGFNFGGLRPDDDLAPASDELDWADVFYRLQREFNVSIPKEAWSEFDGTFDSLVKLVATRMTNTPAT